MSKAAKLRKRGRQDATRADRAERNHKTHELWWALCKTMKWVS